MKSNCTNKYTLDSNKEKQIRGFLKSEVLKHIGPRNLVILDALNYIKGICKIKNLNN